MDDDDNLGRERVPVETIFSRLGQRFIRKAYRMTEFSFWKLLSLLKPYLPKENKRERGATPNGDVSNAARLSMALRWFAGGEPADVMQTHGVGYDEVYHSVWLVVDAVNQCPTLQLSYPTSTFPSPTWMSITVNFSTAPVLILRLLRG